MNTQTEFPYLGLKASTDPAQIAERLRYRPAVFEFFTTPADVTPAGLAHLRTMIEWVQHDTRRIVIHHPMSWHGTHVEIASPDTGDPKYHCLAASRARNGRAAAGPWVLQRTAGENNC